MSKTILGTAIQAAVSEKRKEEKEQASIEANNNSSKIENNNDSIVANDQDIKLQSNDDLKIASEQDSKVADAQEPPLSQQGTPPVELVGLNIRVPKNNRLHWLIAAKKEGTSLTAVVNEALAARYGLPSEE